jgi:pyruvate,orthophosphate dikinase
MTALRHAVLSFDGGTDKTKQSHVRGGKGMSLAEMATLGLLVPPSFTLATGVSRAYMQHGCLPRRVHSQIAREIRALEVRTGLRFGDPLRPLLVSVRSGAQTSMPGMMETLLNVGLDIRCQDGLASIGGEQFANDIADRFTRQWQKLVGSKVPEDPFDQLDAAIKAVLGSWKSERAIAYRNANGISHGLGTAVTVQQMVFGNMDQLSCTGVVFSANADTGEDELQGEFLVRAQGEDVVSGESRTRPIGELAAWNKAVASELSGYVRRLQEHFMCVVDVEFTVERGVLYLLQVRPAKLAPQALVSWTVRQVWSLPRAMQEAAKRRAVASIPPSMLAARPIVAEAVAMGARQLARGIKASPGAATGVVACGITEAQQLAAKGVDVILVRPDTTPGDLPGMLVARAIVTGAGGPTCHAAIVARDLQIPAVVSANTPALVSGTTVTVDADHGVIYQNALPLTESTLSLEATYLKRWMTKARSVAPTVDADWAGKTVDSVDLLADFYLTDAMAREAEGTRREIEAAELRSATHRQIAERLATYLLLAICAEVRHFWSLRIRSTPEMEASAERIKSRFDVAKAARLITNEARPLMQLPALLLARSGKSHQLVRLVEDCFLIFDKPYWGSGYGGDKWAVITKCLLDFLKGELSHSVFADQVFDLRHHGDCLFDKHPMINESSELQRLLDEKKRCVGIRDLRMLLTGSTKISPSVEAIWQTGVSEKLWKE